MSQVIIALLLDTFHGAKPRFLNPGKKCRSVSTLSIPRASGRGVEWVDLHEIFSQDDLTLICLSALP